MNRDPFERTLRDALREDPQAASSDFTRQVMARLSEPPRRRIVAPRPALAAATLVLAAVAGLTAWRGIGTTPAADAEAPNRQQLLEEYRQLEADLDEVRRLVDDTDPMLYLGGTESFDLLYDLESYAPGPQGDFRPAAMPDRG